MLDDALTLARSVVSVDDDVTSVVTQPARSLLKLRTLTTSGGFEGGVNGHGASGPALATDGDDPLCSGLDDQIRDLAILIEDRVTKVRMLPNRMHRVCTARQGFK